MEEEEEALTSYCREMIRRVRLKQQQLRSPGEEEEESRRDGRAGGRRRRGGGRPVVAAGGEMADCTERNLPLSDVAKRHRQQPSLGVVCQGPEVRCVPLQLLSTLRLRTFEADARRVRRRDLRVTHLNQCKCRAPSPPCSLCDLWQAAEVELHDPAVCSACEQEQASLALTTFIWRKKTQLHMQTLKGRLNTHPSSRDRAGWRSLCQKSPQSHLMPLTGVGRDYLVKICGSQQPGVTVATGGERGVALATDEMRGHSDKSATGTHLARPRCPFPDR